MKGGNVRKMEDERSFLKNNKKGKERKEQRAGQKKEKNN